MVYRLPMMIKIHGGTLPVTRSKRGNRMRTRYSGPKSEKFWSRVNSLGKRQGELYSLGVALQNLEGFVLKQLEIAEAEESVGPKIEEPEEVGG